MPCLAFLVARGGMTAQTRTKMVVRWLMFLSGSIFLRGGFYEFCLYLGSADRRQKRKEKDSAAEYQQKQQRAAATDSESGSNSKNNTRADHTR